MSNFQTHIESVRLKNFLSFYEGHVQFDKGLTVIVGPNGSGKTSIFHAIKFAMGSNQRENRYAKWSDFIRHSASSGEAEVVIVDNGTKVSLLRKIDKDGIPKPYIDGKRVKAAELRSKVESMGFDVDNTLVFMPQERINAIRDMDPIEVRKLVEEGTGLDELRDRIIFEESKVSKSKERLESAVAESQAVQRELDLLQHDIDRLQKKRTLLEKEELILGELKWARLDDIDIQLEEIRSEIEQKEKGLGDIIDESTTLRTAIDEDEEEQSAIQKRLDSLQMEQGRIDAKIDENERLLSKLKDDSKQSVDELRQLEREVKTEKRKEQRTEDDLDRSSRALEKYMETQRSLKGEIEEIEVERDRIEDELSEFADWNERRAEVYGTFRALTAELQAKDLLMRSLRERLQIEEAEYQEIQNKWGHLWSTLEEMDEKELTEKKSQIEKQIAGLNEKRFRENSLVAQLQKEISEIRHKLSETTHRMPENVRQLKDAIEEHSLETVSGPLIDILSPDEKYSDIIESVFTEYMAFSFIVTDEAEFTLLRKVRDKHEAESPIILIKSLSTPEKPELPTGKRVVGWLWNVLGLDDETGSLLRRTFGDIVVVEDNRTASRITKNSDCKVVTLDGSVFVSDSLKIVSYPILESTGIVSTTPLQSRLDRAEKELSVAKKRVTEIVLELEKLDKQKEEVMELLGQITRWSSTWKQRAKLAKSIPEIEERIVTLDDEMKELQTQLGKSERELKKLDRTQPPERSKLIGERSALKMKYSRLQSQLSKTEAALHATEKDMDIKRQELKRTGETIEMLSDRVKELKQEVKQSSDTSAQLSEDIERFKESKTELHASRKKLQEDLQRISESMREMSERLVEINLTIRNSRLQVMQSKRQLENLENEREELEEQTQKLERPMNIRTLVTVREDLIKVRALLDDYKDVSESVAVTESELKGKLSQLIEKVDELREELSEAEETVRNIENQYNKGMNETLLKVESEVNDVLSTVQFSGEVRFELIRRNGVYGVDFRLRIRGEDYTGLSAGSGGERSLVAIGLILSLQRFNPAPTYALDEIDTFLDATNTEMVSRLIHDSSRRSQFILFTPAKSTHLLKHADKRLGVVSPGGVEPSVVIESPKFSE